MPIVKRRIHKNVIDDEEEEDIEMVDHSPIKEEKKKAPKPLERQDLESIREARDDKMRGNKSEVTSTTHRDTTANMDDVAGDDAGSVKSLKLTGAGSKAENGVPKASIASLIKP